MDTGVVVFIIGLLGILLGAIVSFRAMYSLFFWVMAVLVLIFSGVVGVEIELFYLSIAVAFFVTVTEILVNEYW